MERLSISEWMSDEFSLCSCHHSILLSEHCMMVFNLTLSAIFPSNICCTTHHPQAPVISSELPEVKSDFSL